MTWAFVVVVLVAVWWWVLPPSLGGRTTVFVTKGVSMEPMLRDGDLAVLHRARTYEVGDVVAFYSKSIRATVLHRVVAVQDGRLTTKGDNNDFLDVDHPRHGDVVGRLDDTVGGVGHNFLWLTKWPVRLAGIALVSWAAYGALQGRRRPDDPLGEVTVPGSSDEDLAHTPPSTVRQRIADAAEAVSATRSEGVPRGIHPHAFGGALVVSLVLIAASLAGPLRPSTDLTVPYTLHSSLGYTAAAAPGGELIYNGGRAITGDPVYPSLVEDLMFTQVTELRTDGQWDGTATVSINAVISGQTGWSHAIAMLPPTTFDGTRHEVSAGLRIGELRALVERIQTLTNIKDNDYLVSVEPKVELNGTIDGGKLTVALPSKMTFEADRNLLTVQKPGASEAPPTSGEISPTPTSSFDKTKQGTVEAAPDLIETLDPRSSPLATLLLMLGIAGVLASALGLAEALGWTQGRRALDVSGEALAEYRHLVGGPAPPPRRPTPDAETRFGAVPADLPTPSPGDHSTSSAVSSDITNSTP